MYCTSHRPRLGLLHIFDSTCCTSPHIHRYLPTAYVPMSLCQCSDSPRKQYTSQAIFDTLAVSSLPVPSPVWLKKRLSRILMIIHPDKSQTVIKHCEKFHITSKVASALWTWLVDCEHFEQHWYALGHPDQDRCYFPWNPEGENHHDCQLPIHLDGRPIVPPSVTKRKSCLAATEIFALKLTTNQNSHRR